MPRRFAAQLLSVAMLLVGVAASPCASSASCMMTAERPMDCCAPKSGIAKPSCCDKQQVQRSPVRATPDRPIQSSLKAPLEHVAALVVPLAPPPHTLLARRIDAGAAPPGGTLIAQHTSLLL